jgi:hypothetical protein
VFGLALCVGESVGLGSGLDDGAAEGEPVNDRGAEPGVGEGFRPAGVRTRSTRSLNRAPRREKACRGVQVPAFGEAKLWPPRE